MLCEKFEERLQELLDERMSPDGDEALLSHAELCDNCRDLLGLQEQLFAGLDACELPPLRAGFARDVVAEAGVIVAEAVTPAPTSNGRRAWHPAWVVAGVALAVMLLVAIVPMARWMGTAAPVAKEPQDRSTISAVDLANDEKVSTPVVPDEPETPSAIRFSPEELAAMAKNADELLSGRPAGEMVRNLSSRLPEVPGERSVEQIPGLRPIASSFSLTFGMVRRTIPGTSTKENPPAPESKEERPSKPQAGSLPLNSNGQFV
jgi:hypothetical protein